MNQKSFRFFEIESMGKTISRSTNKFEVYEFNAEDEQSEKCSKNMAKKYKPKKPQKSPVTKYQFLECFKKQNLDQHKDSKHERVDIEDSIEDSAEGDAARSEATELSSTRNYKSEVNSRSNHPDAKDSVSVANLYANEPIGITSDDDDSIELNSSLTSKSCHADNEGLLEEQVLASGIGSCEFGDPVVVNPYHIIYGKMYFGKSQLTFSSNYLKLEGSPLPNSKGPFPLSVEWAVADIVKIESQWSKGIETAVGLIHLKSKNTKVALNAANPGIEKLNFALNHPHWSKIEDAIRALNMRYKDTWDTVFNIDVSKEDVFMGKFSSHLCPDMDEPFEEVVYPKGDHDAVSIGKRDIQLLEPETFINDTIVDFYMKYLQNKVKREELHRFHFFNSFFFRKLADLDKSPSRARVGKAAFQRVRKWTRKVELFEKDYIFIPVNFSLHWSLIVICHPGEVVNLKDEEEMEKLQKVPSILHMDSIKGSHRGLRNLFQSYLWEEWSERHDELVEDLSSRFCNLPFFNLELPQQENSFDCGLFLLHYAERFMEDAPLNFNPFRISKRCNFLQKNWFVPVEASMKRAQIRSLIYKIAEDNSRKISDERGSSESAECDSGVQLLHENCSYSSCTSDREFDSNTPLAVKPLRSLKYSGEPKLISDALSDSEDGARLLTDGDYHPERQMVLYNRSRNDMSPIEECEESEDQNSATSKSQRISVHFGIEEKPDEPRLSGAHRLELLDTVPEEEDKNIHKCSSSSSDEFAGCVVEDSQDEEIGTPCQSSGQPGSESTLSDQVANSFGPEDGLSPCVVSDSEVGSDMPGHDVECKSPSHQGDINVIEITDSTESRIRKMAEEKRELSAKRPRQMHLEEESPLRKKLRQMILIDD